MILGGIGKAVSKAVNDVVDTAGELAEGVGDLAEGAVDVAGDVAKTGFEVWKVTSGVGLLMELPDTFERIKQDGGIGGIMDDVMDVVSAGSLGSMLNVGMDKLGLPDWVGDVAGGVLDFSTGNYVGAAANALDALEDVAKACGSEEIAGYLKAGSQIVGMFSPGPGGQLGKLGKAGDVIGDGLKIAENVADGWSAAKDIGQNFADGDVLGGLTGAVGAFSDAAPMLDKLGVDPEDLKDFKKVFDQATPFLDGLKGALADGKIDSSDLQHLPIEELAEKAGVDADLLLKQVFGSHSDQAKSIIGDLVAGKQPGEILAGMAEDIVAQTLDAQSDAIKELATQYLKSVAQGTDMAQDTPEAFEMILKDLREAALRQSIDVDLAGHHASSMRM